MTTETKLGASRAVFMSAASSLPMLRGPTIAYSPEDDSGDGGAADQHEAVDPNAQGGAADQTDGEDNPSGEGEGEQPKPKKSAQDRIDELTAARRAAERRADAAEAALADTRKPKDAADAPKEPAEPDPAEYKYGETDPEFIRDLARFEARQAYANEAREHSARTEAQKVEQAWEDRQLAFAKDKADYFDVIKGQWACSPAMADAIVTSDDGAAVAYHLATNPDEARRIAALPIIAQVREIGRLEAKLSQTANPTPEPKTVSDAPTPPPQSRGQGGRFKVAADTDDFSAFERAHSGS